MCGCQCVMAANLMTKVAVLHTKDPHKGCHQSGNASLFVAYLGDGDCQRDLGDVEGHRDGCVVIQGVVGLVVRILARDDLHPREQGGRQRRLR